jgi:hypothetical protein
MMSATSIDSEKDGNRIRSVALNRDIITCAVRLTRALGILYICGVVSKGRLQLSLDLMPNTSGSKKSSTTARGAAVRTATRNGRENAPVHTDGDNQQDDHDLMEKYNEMQGKCT